MKETLAALLKEQALEGGGRVALAALVEKLLPLPAQRGFAREHGLSPKGFRPDKAPAKVLAPLLAATENAELLGEVCAALAERMTAAPAEDAPPAPPARDLEPVLRLKEQELATARAELERARAAAQELRARNNELTSRATQDSVHTLALQKALDALRARIEALEAVRPNGSTDRDREVEIQRLSRDLEELVEIEHEHRIKAAELAAELRERDDRIAELEELVPKGRRKKSLKAPPPPPERFRVPHFTSTFLKSLANRDRRAVEHAYRAVFLYCSEGPEYPGLQVKALDPIGVWSLRASLRLRVYFRPRADGDIDVLELIDRQEQDTMLRRYRERS